jgi:hypothetical protein
MMPNDVDSVGQRAPKPPKGTPEHLARWLAWLETPGCTCPHEWRRSVGSLYGISLGAGWIRLDDAPDCPHHPSNRLVRPKK